MRPYNPGQPKLPFPPGPWKTEPNRLEFMAHGFHCCILRHPYSGHLCGYVMVPPSHRLANQPESDLSVHGGVTYAKPDAEDNWWIGFDCAHYDDASPRRSEGTYRDLAYVRAQIECLAAQLALQELS